MQNSYSLSFNKNNHTALNKHKFFLTLFLSLIISICFYSCTDQVVTVNNTGFDSARYNWESDTINDLYFYDAVFIDTNRIFFLTISALYEYDGENYIRHYMPYPFGGYCISGIDANNIYVGGYNVVSYSHSSAALKKWNGAGFEDFTIADTSDRSEYFHSIYSKSHNEHWLSSPKGKVYKFDGSNFQGFSFDTNYWYIDPFMKDEAGNVYFSSKTYEGNTFVTNTIVEMHKYNGSAWQTVYSENLGGGIGGTFFTENIGNRIYCTMDRYISYFNGSDFTDHITSEDFFFIDIGFAGSSPGNIFISGFSLRDHNEYMYNYNGIKWSKEFIENEDFQNFTVFHTSENMAYAFSFDYQNDRSIILKGVRK